MKGMTEMIVLEEVMVGVGIVRMEGLLVPLFGGDPVLIMVQLAAQVMIGTLVQCMIGEGVLVQLMTGRGALIMGGIGVLSMVDTAGSFLAAKCLCNLFWHMHFVTTFPF